jgi:hypothetical protein
MQQLADKPMSVWRLIEAGRFEEACLEADRLSAAGSSGQEGNKVIALLKLGKLSEAEAQCKRNIDLRNQGKWAHDTQGDWDLLGVAQWLQNKRDVAIESWLRSMDAKYIDLSGGAGSRLLLFYAAKSERLPEIEKMAVRSLETFAGRNGWPAPLASFVLGRIGEADVRDWISPIAGLRNRELCQAEFYFGILEKDSGKRIEHLWRAAYDFEPISYLKPEHHLAIFEFNASKEKNEQ